MQRKWQLRNAELFKNTFRCCTRWEKDKERVRERERQKDRRALWSTYISIGLEHENPWKSLFQVSYFICMSSSGLAFFGMQNKNRSRIKFEHLVACVCVCYALHCTVGRWASKRRLCADVILQTDIHNIERNKSVYYLLGTISPVRNFILFCRLFLVASICMQVTRKRLSLLL